MKDKVNQLFKDKLFLVMMVIGLLTAVAAVGVLTVGSTDENGQSPYLEVPGGELMAKENGQNGADQENTRVIMPRRQQRRHRKTLRLLPRRTQMKMQETTH